MLAFCAALEARYAEDGGHAICAPETTFRARLPRFLVLCSLRNCYDTDTLALRKGNLMSDTERVRAWRQRLKEAGLVPLTVWIRADTKLRYEDLALQSRRSVSEVAQRALESYHVAPDVLAASETTVETLRLLIREELAQGTAGRTDSAREPQPMPLPGRDPGRGAGPCGGAPGTRPEPGQDRGDIDQGGLRHLPWPALDQKYHRGALGRDTNLSTTGGNDAMSPGSRITIRLTQALEALVSDRVRQGSHVSDIVREALAVYLGACLTTRPTPHASVLTSASPVSDSVAALVSDIVSAKVSDVLSDVSASVSGMSDMRARLEQLEARLEELSARVSQRPTPRLTSQPRTPAAAPEAAARRQTVPEPALAPETASAPRCSGGCGSARC